MGVGDLAVPKRMKSIAGLYAGCSQAYAAALDEPGDGPLAAALQRNLFEGDRQRDREALALAGHVRAVASALAATPDAAVIEGRFTLPRPVMAEAGAP
jgi:cytochrome b pre-mRNA-processing protein 3